jgi:phosphoribosylaminoimidazolecarboxamide formyltransferase/IMP cyclohydrolase
VREVSDLTGFPEMLDGRLKTIHPRVAGGVLAIRANPEHMQSLAAHGIPLIDMVVVNLYQFEKVAAKQGVPLSELIANIDIGGPTLIRAGAKNYQDVAVVVSPDDYAAILEELHEREGCLLEPTLWRLAKKAFALTASYDRAISARLARVGAEDDSGLPAFLDIRAPRALDLRYGENPHQKAALYSNRLGGIAGAEQLQGKELSYNNLVDLDAAWQLIREFSQRIHAGARKRRLWRKAIARHSKPILYRHSAECWHSTAPWIAKRPRKSARHLSRPSPRRVMMPRRASCFPPRETCACSPCYAHRMSR